ncbi:hypothetical protein Tco_1345383, partial [Tanacetum coccineum]
MGVTLSGSQGLSSPQANGYVSSMDLTLSGPRLDADFLVADSKFMKVAFGVGFKMIVVPSSGIVTTSRYVVPTGRVKVPAGRYVVPTGKDNVIVSAGRTKVIPAGRTILVLWVLAFGGGTVTFGGGDDKITGKGTIRTSKLNFENVYYVEELQNFNLFSVSQICDTKNKVLFTDKECLVLSKARIVSE